jgi:uncharacterized Zn-binding protein involved in type VI secretion
LKKYIFAIALSLALALVLSVGTALLACGNGCTPAKSGDCGPCPMASAGASSKAQAQTAKAASCPAACQGDPTKCPNPDCLKDGKGCQDKCSMGDAKSNCKASSADKPTKLGTAKVKTVKAVEAKAQPVSNPKNNS